MQWKLYTKVEIADHERGLLFRRGRFVRVLGPGVRRVASAFGRTGIDVMDLRNPVVEHPLAEFLVKTHPELSEHFLVVELGDQEVGLTYVDGKLADVVAPASRKIFWSRLVMMKATSAERSMTPQSPAVTEKIL
jgi:hypothetical protein